MWRFSGFLFAILFDTARGAGREPAGVGFCTPAIISGIPAGVSWIFVPMHWKRIITWFDGNVVTISQE